ncbi:MAG: alpha/beta hydrolase [marine benthic group bacterium]|jgi:pimeloyl-ACP methyl ester carboxylesterase|nr:alpha/beta hydrolase [Gemmatimonadota bacterium]MCL7977543.1 alpha/beta hydrolase [Gemmatimonadota bacterium]MCL7980211.1 alpha/beta hydrolase [Gemmatimonadota bacterium]MCL7982614.1 alpha/beta hydrolase [Gemmatimonadota bacterium]MCL7991432.1 alpha/beta hydrolase [Gemmatimonadota bacterium]
MIECRRRDDVRLSCQHGSSRRPEPDSPRPPEQVARLAPVLIATTLLAATLLAACSDSTTGPGAPTIHGGPDNPARDGSYTEAIVSENGIASLEPIVLGGVEQWILIRGHDLSNPVLVFLHGGPGSPAIPYARFSFEGLERHFTVVTWDQRGCGKSYYDGLDASTITFDRLLSDARELIEQMRSRFGVQKVYLMGLSWGSTIGTLTARDHPDLLHAYIGVGQAVDVERGIPIAHVAAVEQATALGREDALAALETIQTDPVDWEQAQELVDWLEELGLGDIHDHSLLPGFAAEAGALTEYTSANASSEDDWRQLYASSPLIQDQTWLRTLDMIQQVPRLEVPVYFLSGRYDYKTPGVLVEEYHDALDAPAGKRMIWFENSAHVPFIEERSAFHSVMIDTILAGTRQ